MLRAWVAIASLLSIAVICGCAHSPVIAPQSASLPARVELTGVPFHPQDAYQCGPAALATLLNAAGVPVTPAALTPEVYLPGKRGSLQVELLAASRKRDRIPYQLAPQLGALLNELAAGRPVLVLQNLGWRILPIWHFAVVIGYDREADTVTLRSGTIERMILEGRSFLRSWQRAQHWAIVTLKPGELPVAPDERTYLTAVAGLEAVGRLSAAEIAYAAARDHWPLSTWPHVGLANIHLARGELTAAEQGYAAAIKLDPNNIVARNNLAEQLARRGCLELARAHIARAMQLAAGTPLQASVEATARQIDGAKASHCE